jgi:Bacterial conjugation TrbI-like protein
MTRIPIAVFAIPLLCASLLAQSSPSPGSGNAPRDQETPSAGQQAPPSTSAPATAPTAPTGSEPRITPGSVIPVQLAKSIDAKKAKSGDEVVAKVTQDLRNNAGTVVVPKDTKVVGHVTQAQARSKEQKESQVTIAFDHAVLKNGEQMQMPMSIQAIIAPPNRNPTNATAGTEQESSYPGASTSPAPAGGGRYGSMGGGGMAPQSPQTSGVPQEPGSAPAGSPAQPPITGETKGVVGIPDLKLSVAPDRAQGSLVSSEKNNVKLDGGTFLLLRVNQ